MFFIFQINSGFRTQSIFKKNTRKKDVICYGVLLPPNGPRGWFRGFKEGWSTGKGAAGFVKSTLTGGVANELWKVSKSVVKYRNISDGLVQYGLKEWAGSPTKDTPAAVAYYNKEMEKFRKEGLPSPPLAVISFKFLQLNEDTIYFLLGSLDLLFYLYWFFYSINGFIVAYKNSCKDFDLKYEKFLKIKPNPVNQDLLFFVKEFYLEEWEKKTQKELVELQQNLSFFNHDLVIKNAGFIYDDCVVVNIDY